MDNEEVATKTNNGFIKHVFNFDNDTKTEVLNIIQYVVLAIIPMALFNYAVDSGDAGKSRVFVCLKI